MNRNSLLCTAAAVAVAIAGCSNEDSVTTQSFEPNLVHAYKYELKEGVPMQQVLDDTNWAVQELFGTAESPKLPDLIAEDEDLAAVVHADHLLKGQALYKEHLCVTCHGATGNGRGETAALSTPYPRDYRLGVFKFKSTTKNAKPTRDDLATIIRGGVSGTMMKALPNLTDEEVDALIDYVVYLSWRGEVERAMIDDAILELDVAGGERIINPAFQGSAVEEEAEVFDEAWEYATDHVVDIAEDWLDAEDEVVEVELPNDDAIPVPASNAEFREMLDGDQAEVLLASVERGRQLFRGKIAACSKCHGNEGKGDGQTTDYDDWTKDWTVRVGLKPEDRDALIPLMARGALPPKNIHPRNFSEGIFRGGSSPEDLYRRITVGIAGTPMPAVTYVPGEFEEPDVWHLINFIRSLETPPEVTADEPTADEPTSPPAATKQT